MQPGRKPRVESAKDQALKGKKLTPEAKPSRIPPRAVSYT